MTKAMQVSDEASTVTSKQFRDDRLAVFYPVAVFCGVLCGLLQVYAKEPLFTALLVVIFTMIFGVARPRHPWRWLLCVGVPIPVTMLVAQWIHPNLHYTRATIAGSILLALPGFAGAYGGHVMRRVFRELYQSK